MRRWFIDRFIPDAREWTPYGRRPVRGSGLGGPAAMAALLALVIVLLFAPIWHRIALSWTQPAGQVKLAAVWARALSDLDLKPGRVLLTSFTGSWNPDGTLASLQFTAEASDRLQIVVYAERPPGSDSLSVMAGKNGYADTLWAAYQGLDPNSLPDVDQVLRSLDGAGIVNLAAVTNTVLGPDEALQLDLRGTSKETTPVPAFAAIEGRLSSLEESAVDFNVTPALRFHVTKVETGGGTGAFFVALLLVR